MDTEAIAARLAAILAVIRRYRENHYPANWNYGPLPEIEQELTTLLDDLKNPKDEGAI